eukprot:c8848_g1_i2.p1 GENE.c8848_g1_i2~~c8848_g1_i2.p1  ORF type:complete len:534 (+),score=134.67 c8848_g1_i2:175-1776(+)
MRSRLGSFVKSSHSNGSTSPPASPPLIKHDRALTPSGFRKDQLIRIIAQELASLGFAKTVEVLESESGVDIHDQAIQQFCTNALEGNWHAVLSQLSTMQLRPNSDVNHAKFAVLEQKFLELVQAGDIGGALMCLRMELAPLNCCQMRLNELCLILTCDAPTKEVSRQVLLNKLQEFIPSTVLVPKNRLEALLEMAIRKQIDDCPNHTSFGLPITEKNLLEDHKCPSNTVPQHTLFVLEEHNDEVWAVGYSPDGTYMASASKDGLVVIWLVTEEYRVLHRILTHDQHLSFLSFSPNSTMLITCGGDAKLIKIWDVKTAKSLKTFSPHNTVVTCVGWLPDNRRFVSGSHDRLVMMDIDGREIFQWAVLPIHDLRISHDGRRMVGLPFQKRILLFDLDDLGDPEIMDCDDLMTSIDISPDSRLAVVNATQGNGELHLIDLAERCVVKVLRGHVHTRLVIRSRFGSIGSNFIASGSEDSNVYIWNYKFGSMLQKLEGHTGVVNAVSWHSRTPGVLASASDDHTIRIWGMLPRNALLQ